MQLLINLIARPDASLAKVSNSSPATARGALEIRKREGVTSHRRGD